MENKNTAKRQLKYKINNKTKFYFSLQEKARFKAKSGKNYFYSYPKNSLIIDKGISDILYYQVAIENDFKYIKHLTINEISSLAERILKWFEKNPRHKSIVILYRSDNAQ